MPEAIHLHRVRKDVLLWALGDFVAPDQPPYAYGWDDAADQMLVTAYLDRVRGTGRLPHGALIEIASKFDRPPRSIAQHLNQLKHRGMMKFEREYA